MGFGKPRIQGRIQQSWVDGVQKGLTLFPPSLGLNIENSVADPVGVGGVNNPLPQEYNQYIYRIILF